MALYWAETVSETRYAELLDKFGGIQRQDAEEQNMEYGHYVVTVKITPNQNGNPPGKLADAELHFTGGVLDGLKLIGFSVCERRTGNGRNVTFPARSYAVNGERRSFALLRPIDDVSNQERVRTLILDAYAAEEEGRTVSQG